MTTRRLSSPQGAASTVNFMLGLQRTHGNSHVQRFIQRCGGVPCNCSPEERAAHAPNIARAEASGSEPEIAPVPNVHGHGRPHRAVAHSGGRARQIHLRGRTNAHFNGGAFHTENVVTEQGEECPGCRARNCVHVTGDVVIDYAVTTTVTLPSMPRGLTACQRERVQEAIDTDLRPHEQDHVTAFETYNGSNTVSFDRTLCRHRFNALISGLVHDDETPRRDAAQEASDALDPHVVTVDLNCTDNDNPTPAP